MTIILAKGLYRRALARIAVNELTQAEKDLVDATQLTNDQDVKSQLEKVRKDIKANKEREKAKFKKLFA